MLKNEDLNMLEMYKDAIQRGPEDTLVIYQHADGSRSSYTYDYISKQSDKLVETLKQSGLKKGDRIGVISALRPWWYALTYACLRSGYIMVCIDPGVPVTQMQKMLISTEVRSVFTTLDVIHLPESLDGHIPVYSIDEDFPLKSKRGKVDILLRDSIRLPEKTFFILFSSGTTSENRKAVLLDHATVTKGIEYGMATDTGVYKDTSAYPIRKLDLMLFPPYHIAGLLCATYDFYCHTQIIMLERLTPNNLMKVFEELKPDNMCTVPSMLNSLYNKILAGYSKKKLLKIGVNTLLGVSGFARKNFGIKLGRKLLKSLNIKAFGGNMEGFMIGASPFDATAHEFFLNMGIDVSMAYGLTELGAPLAVTGQGYYPGTTGRVVKHKDDIDIRIVNKDDTGRGEVEVLSPYRMISYMYKKDNVGCFTEDGYFKTGDLGYFDKNNCLVICGRSKESIVLKNGEKLLPEEIESKYQDLNQINEVAVFKVPGQGGCDEFSIAVIKNKAGGIPDEAIKTRVYDRAAKLPPMYRPKDVYVIKEFPLSSSHKIQRFRLTQMVIDGKTEPTTDASMIPIDEDAATSKLRKILIKVGGSEWKTQKLTQGLLLNLDSLSTVDLYAEIQNEWQIDLFQTSSQPETFGQLLDIVKNYELVDKKKKKELDLSKYPMKVSFVDRVTFGNIEKLANLIWRVKGYGVDNLPKDTNFIMCSNHRTYLDPGFICGSLPKKIEDNTCILGKSDIDSDKILRRFALSHNYIPIERTGNSIKTLDRSRELLNEGWNLLIFPEGTSVQNNTKLYPLKDGAARLSIDTRKPIVPVHITGIAVTDKEIKSFELPSLLSKVKVKFGDPIYPGNMDVKELNDLLATKIEELD